MDDSVREPGTEPEAAPPGADPRVYADLREAASRLMRKERADHTLSPTALVHEAFMRLGDGRDDGPTDRATYVRYAVRVMRQVLVDHARRRGALKRGQTRVPLGDPEASVGSVDVIELDDLLDQLGKLDDRRARVAELRIFGGLGNAACAEQLGIARSTAASDWAIARAWLAARWNDDRAEEASDARE